MPLRPRESPYDHFNEWFQEAKETGMRDPNAFALATSTPEGMPSVRIVLLKNHDERGFVFFTNLESDKGQALLANPKAALNFWWYPLGRQVRADGPVEQVTKEEADDYFASRARMSQIGAWASSQSRPMESREDFERRIREFEQKFTGANIPRPPHWSGFRIKPVRIEFWQEAEFRLHERLVYLADGEDAWATRILYP